ncbi:MAG: ABC transporter ATP-binding protein [Eubacterium sp.]|nr:ABC transporter ATP-binding protein [Eubacterium sp.]
MILLEAKDLSKNFGPSKALDSINLTLECGKIVGLLGPNGSGKTTLLKIINGLLVPTSGSIMIGGETPNMITKQHISYLPDATFFPKWMKVSNLFDYFGDFYADFDRAKAAEMLKRLDISEKMKLQHMSKGTLEKAQLILAMSRNANLYCLDEPIGGVDPATRDYILQTIINNYSEESTVLISTHLISDVESVLDDVVFLQNGQIRLHSSVDDIREKEGKSVDELFREVFRC